MDFRSPNPCVCGANAVANADVITAVRGELSVLRRATKKRSENGNFCHGKTGKHGKYYNRIIGMIIG
jgi:FPC/CPF motif-containing protein YcgG